MIEKAIWYSLISFFSIYGFVSMVIYLKNLADDIRIMKGKTVFTVVAVKNEEERIEGITRALLFKAASCDSGISDSRVVIVDMGSSDSTCDIIRRMERDKRGVTLMTVGELNESICSST